MPPEPLEYERSPIPDAALLDVDGGSVSLTGLAQERAVLLVCPGPRGDERDSVLRTLSQWHGRMPLVDFVVVTQEPGGRDDPLLKALEILR